ncbi:MAG: exodeoxyribonuclease VII large subunit, partial [Pseudooceanicola sp.]|nr:exodeoxyribonuclease VII large subunit [Pseudooceanicola sp.]
AWAEGMGARLARAATGAVQSRRQRLADLSRALPRRESLLEGARQRLDRVSERLDGALTTGVRRRELRLSQVAGSLRPALLQRLVATRRDALARRNLRLEQLQRRLVAERDALSRLARRLSIAATSEQKRRESRLLAAERLLASLGHQATLERGYAIVRAGGDLVTTRAAAATHATLEIEFADGRLDVAQSGARPARRGKAEPPGGQGSLF